MALDTLRLDAAEAVRLFVDAEGAAFPALRWVRHALAAPGKLLGPPGRFAWGLLPLLVCEAAGGDPRRALPLGVAAECFMAAADIFDDIQDDDTDAALHRACGLATAANVATFLLCLTPLAIARLADQGAAPDAVAAIAQAFAASGAAACIGQQLDLELRGRPAVAEDQYLDVARRTAGSLVACLCRSGALLATGNQEAIDAFATFGGHLGVALQIGNDVAAFAASPDAPRELRADLRTLPIIFAFHHPDESLRAELAALLDDGSPAPLTPVQIQRLRAILIATGALEYAALIADVSWEHALGSLPSCAPAAQARLVHWLTDLREHGI